MGALRGGTQELFIPTTTSLAPVVKEFGLLDFPFLVSTTAQAEALPDGPAGAALPERLPAKGLIGLGYWENGFRNVTNSARPIQKPEDFAGLKLRGIPNLVALVSDDVTGYVCRHGVVARLPLPLPLLIESLLALRSLPGPD